MFIVPARDVSHDVRRCRCHDVCVRTDLGAPVAGNEEEVAQLGVARAHVVDAREELGGVVRAFCRGDRGR